MSNIVIDDNLRTMTIPSDIVLLGVESDDDVNKIPFVMPKEYCGYDLTTFEARINYMNANGDGDIYVVEDLAIDEEDPTKMKFTWLVGRNACMYKGNTQFIVCLKKFAADDTGTVVQEFNTTVYSLPVLQGLETTDAVEQQNADIIEYILQRIQEAGMIDPSDYYTKEEVDALIPTELPNPEVLTINGQSYDGSEAVDITIEASNEVISTASGKLIHVVDAIAGEVKTLSLYDAYDTELSSGEIAVTNKNLFRIDQLADHVVSKGVSFDKNADGSITVSGTSTGTYAMTTCDLDRNMFIIGQAYTLSTGKTVGYCYAQLILTYIDGTVDYMIAMNSSRTFTIEKEVSSCVASVQITDSGVTIDDEVVYPMLEVGSSASKFTDNSYSSMTYDGTTMPVLPAAISNVWANDDAVANMVMTYSASTILNEIDNYAEANLKSNDNSTLVALYDGVGTVMLGEDVENPAAIPLTTEVDTTLSIAGMAADAKATGDAIKPIVELSEEMEKMDNLLVPYIGNTATLTKDSQSGTWASEIPFNGTAGKLLHVTIADVNPAASTINIFLMHSDNTYQTFVSSGTVGTDYVNIVTADFVKIRIQVVFSSYPAIDIKMNVNWWFDEIVKDDVAALVDSVGFNVTKSKVWSGSASVQYPIAGKANKKYYFSIDSLDVKTTTIRAIYFMKLDGTYFTAKSNPTVGSEYSYIPSDDFIAIRFYLAYSPAPQNNNVVVSFGTRSKNSTMNGIEGRFVDDETDYISGICAPVAIGDSITIGFAVSKVSGLSNVTNPMWSWATQLFKKKHGTDVDIIAQGGATAKTILENFSTELSQITNSDCVCIYLGTNQDKDAGGNTYPIGTVDDIVANWDDTPTNTFIGWYSKLVRTIQHYNSAYGFCVCFGLVNNLMSGRTDAIHLICNNISGCIFQPTEEYSNLLTRLTDNDDGTHWTPIGYAGYASVFNKALNTAIYNNPTIVNKTANVFRN